MSRERPLNIEHYNVFDYGVALERQENLHRLRMREEVPDTLMLLQHPPTITTGRGTKPGHILWSEERLRQEGVAVADIGRGGDVTLHGPGQLVGYPIVDLKPDRCDVRLYVRALEEVMLRTLNDFGIEGSRRQGMIGVWIGNMKVGAVGVRISRWVTLHGFALNVCNEMRLFEAIVPCGIREFGVTSVTDHLRRDVAFSAVEARAEHHFRTWHQSEDPKLWLGLDAPLPSIDS